MDLKLLEKDRATTENKCLQFQLQNTTYETNKNLDEQQKLIDCRLNSNKAKHDEYDSKINSLTDELNNIKNFNVKMENDQELNNRNKIFSNNKIMQENIVNREKITDEMRHHLMQDVENAEIKHNETENSKNMLTEEKAHLSVNLDESKNRNYMSANLIHGIENELHEERTNKENQQHINISIRKNDLDLQLKCNFLTRENNKLMSWVEDTKQKLDDLNFYLKQKNGEIAEKEDEERRLNSIIREAHLRIEN